MRACRGLCQGGVECACMRCTHCRVRHADEGFQLSCLICVRAELVSMQRKGAAAGLSVYMHACAMQRGQC